MLSLDLQLTAAATHPHHMSWLPVTCSYLWRLLYSLEVQTRVHSQQEVEEASVCSHTGFSWVWGLISVWTGPWAPEELTTTGSWCWKREAWCRAEAVGTDLAHSRPCPEVCGQGSNWSHTENTEDPGGASADSLS